MTSLSHVCFVSFTYEKAHVFLLFRWPLTRCLSAVGSSFLRLAARVDRFLRAAQGLRLVVSVLWRAGHEPVGKVVRMGQSVFVQPALSPGKRVGWTRR